MKSKPELSMSHFLHTDPTVEIQKMMAKILALLNFIITGAAARIQSLFC